MSELYELCGRVLALATDILTLCRSSDAPDDRVVDKQSLRTYASQLGAVLQVLNALECSDASLATSCHILASDLILRIGVGDDQAACRDGVPERLWPDHGLATLNDRVEALRRQISKPHENNAADRSRSLWTSGEHALPRAGVPNGATQSLTSPPATSELGPTLEADIQATLRNEDKTEMLREFFLESLAFPSMDDREDEVSDAHNRSFEWIFDGDGRGKDASSFVTWLATPDLGQLYWINGKAGSGKSTLLRFIARHPKTTDLLRQYAGRADLIMMSFFFWTGGTLMQRSEAGLLRSLLHQLLTQRPEFIPWTFPRLWLPCQDTKTRIKMVTTWEVPELTRALQVAFRKASKQSKVCLFVDGLDEFEGSEQTVIYLVRSIIGLSANIKVCASSRPWEAFERAFEDVPHLLLQDLTKADMQRYIHGYLLGSDNTRNLVHGNDLGPLYADIHRQANGVFLWTRLALAHLVDTVGHDTGVDTLQNRINSLPSDLEDLFRHLLCNGTSEAGLVEQSRILSIIRARDNVCDLTGDEETRAMSLYQLHLAFLGRTEDVALPVKRCNEVFTLEACSNMAAVLNDRCAGLIVLSAEDKRYLRTHTRAQAIPSELRQSANRRVGYLHRTVRDFLAYSNAAKRPSAPQDPEVEEHICLLRSHVLRLRRPLGEPEKHRRLDDWWHEDIVPAMTHARCASTATAQLQVTLLDSLDRTLQSLWRGRTDSFGRSDPLDQWARHAFGTYELREKHKTPFHRPFLSLAAKFGLAEYLRVKLTSEPDLKYKAGIPLLSHAIEMLISRRKSVYPLTSPAVIKILLECGEDPNKSYKNMFAREETPWLVALKNVREGKRRSWIVPFDIDADGSRRWAEVLQVMLRFGADPKAIIVKDQWDPEVTALEVVTDVAETYFDAEVWKVKAVLAGVN